MLSYHSPLRKSVRWFLKLAIEVLLGLSIVNAHCLFNMRQSITGGEQMSITAFRESICNSLLRISNITFANQHHIPASHSSTDVESDSVHFLRECSEREGGRRQDRRRRRYCIGCCQSLATVHGRCIAKKKAKRVTTECSACPSNPRFCFECFPKFHST